MSTQRDTGIPFTHAPDGVGYKLMELPPELLEALESDNPPVLTLESSENSAVLKSGTQSWGLRQKNTSNALILLRPSESTQPSWQIPETALKAVATVHDTIELVSEPSGKAAPVARGRWHEKFARGR
ncbi:Uu.00g048990.m01.CDS01 [Anthostomella pinea]|uniref:Uu.00g048990.m01.CDS01 n=1 Tax=Anthostomella pinea TaxID=933095 RepID=A0AAI8VCT8_9PEZI|nr:Uu.00g048990.m01.CDS01 [Anthostomella pinea]